jgi:hypothetical protein
LANVEWNSTCRHLRRLSAYPNNSCTCHVERSETSLFSGKYEILRFAQNDSTVRPWLFGYRYGYFIPLLATDFERGRLTVDSFIRPNRLFTVDHSVILYTAA